MKRDHIVEAIFNTIIVVAVAAVVWQYHWLPRAAAAFLQVLALCAVWLRCIAKSYDLGWLVILHGDRAPRIKPGGEIIVPDDRRVLRQGPALEDSVRAHRPEP